MILCAVTVAVLGCGGVDAQRPGDAGGGAAGLTWYKDVLPITQAKCQGCHVQGGIAPFPLESWAQAQPHHAAMADAVAARRMPPWPANDACIALKDSRRRAAPHRDGWPDVRADLHLGQSDLERCDLG